jgi:hypothetical protein
VICYWCGTVFCWDYADVANNPKYYCTRTCKNHAKRWRETIRKCEQQHKIIYLTHNDALNAASVINDHRRQFKPLRPVRCDCKTHWHLTSNKIEKARKIDLTEPNRPVYPDQILETMAV